MNANNRNMNMLSITVAEPYGRDWEQIYI
jgi:hypothetical protein